MEEDVAAQEAEASMDWPVLDDAAYDQAVVDEAPVAPPEQPLILPLAGLDQPLFALQAHVDAMSASSSEVEEVTLPDEDSGWLTQSEYEYDDAPTCLRCTGLCFNCGAGRCTTCGGIQWALECSLPCRRENVYHLQPPPRPEPRIQRPLEPSERGGGRARRDTTDGDGPSEDGSLDRTPPWLCQHVGVFCNGCGAGRCLQCGLIPLRRHCLPICVRSIDLENSLPGQRPVPPIAFRGLPQPRLQRPLRPVERYNSSRALSNTEEWRRSRRSPRNPPHQFKVLPALRRNLLLWLRSRALLVVRPHSRAPPLPSVLPTC